MTPDRDPLLADLARLDPARGIQPPSPGSARYDSILEHAMSTDAMSTTAPSTTAPTNAPTEPERRRRLPTRTLAAAAALVALVVGVAVVGPGRGAEPADAAVALGRAADATGEVETLRIVATYEEEGSSKRITGEVDGADVALDAVATYADGHVERQSIVSIGDTVWEDGTPTRTPPEQRNAAYAPSSAAVVEAVLDGSTLEDRGDEEVDGVTARHIRVALGPGSIAALGALSPSQVAMFELEYPEGVRAMDLWIADDLIRRIRVVLDHGDDGDPHLVTVDVRFRDFGADVAIEPPS